LWFAAEICSGGGAKVYYEVIDHAHVPEGADEDMKYLSTGWLEKEATAHGGRSVMPYL